MFGNNSQSKSSFLNSKIKSQFSGLTVFSKIKSQFTGLTAVVLLLIYAQVSLAQTKVSLALNWKAEPQFGGFYNAQLNGAFKQNGLDVEIAEGGSGTPTVQMVAFGKVDFAVVSADEVILSRAKGTDVVALFAVYQTNPQGIMTHSERNFQTLADVFKSDGVLALQSGLPYSQFLMKKYAPVKVKTVPYSGGVGLFLSDKKISQQCFVTSEPLLAEKSGAKVKTFLVSESGYNPYTTVVVARKSYIEKNKVVVEKFVDSVRKGWADYLKDPSQANRKMQTINKSMDADTFQKAADAQKSLILPDQIPVSQLGVMTFNRWQTLLEQMIELKVLDLKDKEKVKIEDVLLKL
jgi:NitT/TauT family transport system substrate-binding protein